MNLLSTFAIFAIAIQCATAASTERKLLRSGYDSPIDFSTITGGNTATQKGTDAALPALPGVGSITQGLSGVTGGGAIGKDSLSKLLPGGLPSTDALSSLTKGGAGVDKLLPTDLSSLTKGGALSSITGGSSGGIGSITNGLTKGGTGLDSITKGAGLDSITSGLTKGGNLPSLPGLPIGDKADGGVDATKGLSSITDTLSGVTKGLKLPSTTSTTGGDKNAYTSESNGDKTGGSKSPNQETSV
ncbi:hypothetical protein P3T76_006033 [Phytophthora citrophthora]|uniref:Uncharacterized protein n=1 Tax=Phytophthora citrophthora TaxID=4793 RepID=A0AAD9LMF6_9STRA|nr:hypothetical protein P3T76_006030 [Phytophthora citrophthora]KAK1942532.1 hypothetical protein P3T76_006031 [Phytophthora citrophthora]KAK1942533.1 hypothetical protein P3T76_006032 [Phytophthora citrophthora]KAK1942534.1 hypothetical protein P3T76_006033 [Phytophthora citrophthora]